MIDCLRTYVRKQPIIALYFESETVLKFYNLGAWCALIRAVSREYMLLLQANDDVADQLVHSPSFYSLSGKGLTLVT